MSDIAIYNYGHEAYICIDGETMTDVMILVSKGWKPIGYYYQTVLDMVSAGF